MIIAPDAENSNVEVSNVVALLMLCIVCSTLNKRGRGRVNFLYKPSIANPLVRLKDKKTRIEKTQESHESYSPSRQLRHEF